MSDASRPFGTQLKRRLFVLLTGVVFLSLLVLGTWQVQRMQWKQSLLASIDARSKSQPQSLSDIEHIYLETGDVDYRPVVVSGQFEHQSERHFFATHKGLSGYFVYTPLRLADRRVVFVNRGFVPFDRKEPATRREGQIDGPVSVTGLARNRLDRKPSWVVPDNDLSKNIYYWKDITSMSRQGGYAIADEVVPLFVDADEAPNPGGLPIGGVTIVNLPDNHLQYALTWYGLAASLAGVFGFWYWRQRIRD